MLVNKNGHNFDVEQVWYDGSDFWRRFEVNWEVSNFHVMDRLLKPHHTFVDIGAWIGPLTLYASRLCRHVYAAEPDRIALNHLHKNVEANCDNVTIDERAIATVTSGVHISSRRALGHSNTNIIGHGGEKGFVPSTTMHNFFKEHGIRDVGLLKMDIEGGEFFVLPGCIEWLAKEGIPILLGLHGPHLADKDSHLYDELIAAIYANYKYVYNTDNLGATRDNFNSTCTLFMDILMTNEALHDVAIADD
jgi:FkbM family methyltransferase